MLGAPLLAACMRLVGARLFVAASGVSVLLLALTSGNAYRRVWLIVSCDCQECQYEPDGVGVKDARDAASLFDDDDVFLRDFSELADLYERLCQKMRSVNVRVLTANKELCIVGYGELLVPGTVVRVEGRKYFYCGERNANELESSWAADDGSVVDVQRFLCGMFESDVPVEVVLMGDEY